MSNPSSPPRFQFSLRWMLAAVTAVALLLGVGAFPAGRMVVGLFLAVLLRGVIPTVAIVAAIYGRGNLRVFAIGAVVSCVPILVGDIGSLTFSSLVVATITQLVAACMCGGVAIVARRWLIPHGGTDVK